MPLLDLQKLKSESDILHIIGRSIKLRRMGRLHKGLCPFHKDAVPSLTVYSDTQSFYCFGCAASGDVIAWVRRYYGLEFREAIEFLQNEQVNYVRPNHRAQEVSQVPTKVIPVSIVQYWHFQLGAKRGYFHERLFNDLTIDQQLFGFSGTRFVIPVWVNEPQKSPLLQVRLRKVPKDQSESPKYIGLTGFNSPQIYNSYSLKGAKSCFVFFGEFDAALCWQDGFPAVSPTGGAATWQEKWNEYFRYIPSIIFVPDRGESELGYRAAMNIGSHVKVFRWPEAVFGKDYNEFRVMGGTKEEFIGFVKQQFPEWDLDLVQ